MTDVGAKQAVLESSLADVRRLKRDVSEMRIAKFEADAREAKTLVRGAECERATYESGLPSPRVVTDTLNSTGGAG